jgi:hypothetical protein
VTQLITAFDFLQRADALWPDSEVTLRGGRVARVIERHDEYLKKRGWYDIITATFDENWTDFLTDVSIDDSEPDG